MNFLEHRFTLDVRRDASKVCVRVRKGDTARRLRIALVQGVVPYEIRSDCYAMFSAVKPDGNRLFNPCTIEDNRIVYELTPQTTAVIGLVECEIRLYGADDALITSPGFDLIVDEVLYDEDKVPQSETEVNALTGLISDAAEVIAEGRELIGEFGSALGQIEGVRDEAEAAAEAAAAAAESAKTTAGEVAKQVQVATDSAEDARVSADMAGDAAAAAVNAGKTATTAAGNAAHSAEEAVAAAEQAKNYVQSIPESGAGRKVKEIMSAGLNIEGYVKYDGSLSGHQYSRRTDYIPTADVVRIYGNAGFYVRLSTIALFDANKAFLKELSVKGERFIENINNPDKLGYDEGFFEVDISGEEYADAAYFVVSSLRWIDFTNIKHTFEDDYCRYVKLVDLEQVEVGGCVRTVNGKTPDENGNVEIAASGSSQNGGFVAQPEPPDDTNLLWIDTDDDSGDEPETEPGGYYTPTITQPDANTMQVAFTASTEGMPSVEPVQVTLLAGPRGEIGPAGPQGVPGKDGQDGAPGKAGADGKTPARGTDYWTDADKAEIKAYVDEAILGGAW